MGSIRQQLLQRFSLHARVGEPDHELANALYSMLRFSSLDVIVDGWALCRVAREAEDFIEAFGLMTLLPSGSVPLAVSVRAHEDGLAWSVQIGSENDDWLAVSASKRWNSVYLYATGAREEPPWTWGPPRHGLVRRADA